MEANRVSSPPFLVFTTYALEWYKGASMPLHCSHNGVLSVMEHVIIIFRLLFTTKVKFSPTKVFYKMILVDSRPMGLWFYA